MIIDKQVELQRKRKFQWNIENMVMIIIKHLPINKVSVLINPLRVDMLLNKPNPNYIWDPKYKYEFIRMWFSYL